MLFLLKIFFLVELLSLRKYPKSHLSVLFLIRICLWVCPHLYMFVQYLLRLCQTRGKYSPSSTLSSSNKSIISSTWLVVLTIILLLWSASIFLKGIRQLLFSRISISRSVRISIFKQYFFLESQKSNLWLRIWPHFAFLGYSSFLNFVIVVIS